MAFHALKHRDVSEVNRVFERFVRFVARFALAIFKPAEINGMLYWNRHRSRRGARRVGQDCVANVAIVPDRLAGITNVLTIVTTKTT